MRYLLDTGTLVYFARGKMSRVAVRFAELAPGDAGMSVVTYLELRYGAAKSREAGRASQVIDQFARMIPVLPLVPDVGDEYCRIRLDLERSGKIIGAYDLLIAAHALSLGLTLVTNNAREFGRIRGLAVENWAE